MAAAAAKTTLPKIILGLLPPTESANYIINKNMWNKRAEKELHRKTLGAIPGSCLPLAMSIYLLEKTAGGLWTFRKKLEIYRNALGESKVVTFWNCIRRAAAARERAEPSCSTVSLVLDEPTNYF